MPGAETRPGTATVLRLLLGVLAAVDGGIGLWAALAPRGFYDDFPGGGRTWVSIDGPYNEHLVRDFGDLNLALAVVLVIAAVTLQPTLVRAIAVALLVYGVPHLVYHVRHLEPYEGFDAVANIASLSLAVAAPALILVLASTRSTSRPD